MPTRAIYVFLSAALACTSSEAPSSDAGLLVDGLVPDSNHPYAPDATASPPTSRIETDVFYVVAEGDLTNGGGMPTRTRERLRVYMAGDTPLYVRDERFGALSGRIYDLRFAAGADASNDVHLDGDSGCVLRVRRDGCATFEYDACFRRDPNTDTGPQVTGTLAGCPNDEHTPLWLDLGGELVPPVVLPDGRARVFANFRLDLTRDSLEVAVNGELREVTLTLDDDPDSATLELGSLPPNASLVARYVGTREGVDFAHFEGFRTTTTVVDLGLDDVGEDSIDARGATVEHVDGALVIRRPGAAPHPAFAFAVAVGEPPAGATSLEVDLTARLGLSSVQRYLVRANGEYVTGVGPLDLPAGEGPVWLVLAHPGVRPPDGGSSGDVVLDGMTWR
ncbi:MAG: hypothetical protein H6721_27750 [Sandaracinus sp.]|nr:hypothetical protein [Sandaracinus sp.]MCB9621019.1 hypothetical protein [Sandaracinus sp.]MCB9635921.1 hypothetical protein [Sandaracinus sp.]